MRALIFICVLVFCAFQIASGVGAPNYSRIELLSGVTALGDGGPILLGIRIEPRPGWKTYWRAPGESGLPPVFTFRAHDNMDAPQIKWPAPKRLILQGLESYGYDGPVIFPFYVQPHNIAAPARLEVQIDYAVCMDICVPEQAALRLVLLPGAAKATNDTAALQVAAARVPRLQNENSQPRINTAQVQKNGTKTFLLVEAEAANGFGAPDLFADGPSDLLFGPPQISYRDGKLKAAFIMSITPLDPAIQIIGQTVTLTLTDREIALEKQAKLAEQAQTE